MQQARRIKANRRSLTGIYDSIQGPFEFESQLERDAYILLEFEPWVRSICIQPMRLENYVPDCLILTHSQMLLAEIKYKAELHQKWDVLYSKFEKANKAAAEDGMIFGFITDSKVYGRQNRLDVLRWVKFQGRSSQQNETMFSQLFADELSINHEISIKALLERIPDVKIELKVQQICSYILSGLADVKETPTQDPFDAVLCGNTGSLTNEPNSVFIAYVDHVRNHYGVNIP